MYWNLWLGVEVYRWLFTARFHDSVSLLDSLLLKDWSYPHEGLYWSRASQRNFLFSWLSFWISLFRCLTSSWIFEYVFISASNEFVIPNIDFGVSFWNVLWAFWIDRVLFAACLLGRIQVRLLKSWMMEDWREISLSIIEFRFLSLFWEIKKLSNPAY